MPAADDDQIERAMQGALADHAAGRYDAARAAYHRSFVDNPDHARAMHSLGVLEKTLGRADTAVELILPRHPLQAGRRGVPQQPRRRVAGARPNDEAGRRRWNARSSSRRAT
jgi:hypothetical protein